MWLTCPNAIRRAPSTRPGTALPGATPMTMHATTQSGR